MKILLTALHFFVFTSVISAQDDLQKKAHEIMQEGKKLYRLEMASWYGTDIFLEQFKSQSDQFSGYLSYTDEQLAHCIFYSKGEQPKVLATISFDSTYNVNTAKVDGTQREFTALEKDLYDLRRKTVAQIETDSLFQHYQKTSFNIVPLLDGNSKKVYVLTGTSQQGVVLFGNDYLLTYDKNNELVSKRQLHKSLIPIQYGQAGEGKDAQAIGAMHSHLPEMGELMTATDICTLMLYQKLTNWKQHIVVSKNFVSIWDCQKNILLALTKEAWEKIGKD